MGNLTRIWRSLDAKAGLRWATLLGCAALLLAARPTPTPAETTPTARPGVQTPHVSSADAVRKPDASPSPNHRTITVVVKPLDLRALDADAFGDWDPANN